MYLFMTREREKEGMSGIKVRSLGGFEHLLTFEDGELMDLYCNECKDSLERWYSEIKPWNENIEFKWRETWITCFGIPINAWSFDNFIELGSVGGNVISINAEASKQERFDKCRIHIITDCMFKINDRIIFEVDEKQHVVLVCEEDPWQPYSRNSPGAVIHSNSGRDDNSLKSNNEDSE